MPVVEATTNQLLRNDMIKHSHYLESYKTNTVNEILSVMNTMDSELKEKLSNYKSINTFTKKRVQIMQKDTSDIINEANKALKKTTFNNVGELAEYESEFVLNSIKKDIPDEVTNTLIKNGMAFVQPSPIQLLSAVKSSYFQNTTITDLMDDWSKKKQSKFNGAIQQGYLQGKGVGEIIDSLFGTKKNGYQDGIAYGSRKQLSTAIRTSLAHTSNVSREITYKQNKSVVKGKQWVSTLDGRTSELCISLDGLIDLFDGSKKELNGQVPPAHYGCRSTTVPVIKSLKELGLANKDFSPKTRASMNGQVSAKENYSSWFKKQSKTFQKDTLGSTKYEMYNSGGFTLNSFVSNGIALSIAQLKAKETVTKVIPKTIRNYDSNLAKGIGKDNYDNMHNIIDNSTEKEIALLWSDWENEINVGGTGRGQGAYFDNHNINFDLVNVVKGDSISRPYQTIFHESGHAIDRAVGLSKNKYSYSFSYENGLFPKTVTSEVENLINSYTAIVKKDMLDHATDVKYLYTHRYIRPIEYDKFLKTGAIPKKLKKPELFAKGKLTTEMKGLSELDRGDLFDIIEGATNGKIKLGVGHGTSYWDKGYKKTSIESLKGRELASEAFAEMIDSSLGNKESLEIIKKYLPKSHELFKKMIKEI